MVLQSGILVLHVTILAAILTASIGQNECPQIVYVEDIQEESQPGVLTFDGLQCNVTIEKRDNSNDLDIVLLIIAAAGFLLWISTTCIAFCICCYKRKDTRVEKDRELGLVLGQPHCAPPGIPAPRPGENVTKKQDDHYARVSPLESANEPNNEISVSREDHDETAGEVDSEKSEDKSNYLVRKISTNQKASPWTKETAKPQKFRSKSVTEDSPQQTRRDVSRPDSRTSVRSVSTSDPNVDTKGLVDFRDQLKMVLSKDRNILNVGTSNNAVNGNLNGGLENEVGRVISDELIYERVESDKI